MPVTEQINLLTGKDILKMHSSADKFLDINQPRHLNTQSNSSVLVNQVSKHKNLKAKTRDNSDLLLDSDKSQTSNLNW